MRKTFNLSGLLMLLVFMLTGYSTGKAANVTIGTPFTVEYSGVGEQYYFTPSESGAATITLTPAVSYGGINMGNGGDTFLLYTASDKKAVAAVSSNGETVGPNHFVNVTEAVFNVTAGTQYYVQIPYWEGEALVTMGGSSNPGGGEENPGGGTSTGTIQTGVQYDVASGSPLTGTFVPSVSGKLTVTYKEGSDPIVSQIWDPIIATDASYSNWLDVDGNTGGIQVYNVTAGTTYYVKAAVAEGLFGTVEGEPLGYPFNVTFTLEGNGGGDNPGGGDDNPGGEVPEGWNAVVYDQLYSIPNGSELKLVITPTTDGVLTVIQQGSYERYLFNVPTDNIEDYSNMTQANNDNEYQNTEDGGYLYTYNLKANKNYYFYGVHDNSKYIELSSVIFKFDGGGDNPGGGGDDNPGGEVPAGWDAMQMNQNYTPNAVGAVKLAFTPLKSGKLIATQTGTYDSHLFNAEPNYSSEYGYDNNYDKLLVPQNGYENETTASVFPLEYGVAAGVTYYFVAKLTSGDPISNVNFKFEEIETGNEIQLNIPYTVTAADGIYTYTASETGVLSVQWSNPSPTGDPCYSTGIVWGAQQYFFYEDPGLSQPVGMLSQGDGNGGWLVTFGVEEGKTYYFHSPEAARYQVVFSLEAGDVEASIVVINPTPGTAYNVVDYRYYMNILTAPATSTVERVTLTYVPKGQKEATTIEMSGTPQNFGELQVPVDDLVSRIEGGDIEPDTDVTITLYGLKAGGEYVTKNALTNGDDYVTIGENGLVAITYTNGTPIALRNSTFPSPFRRAWERGDKEGIATLTYDQEIYVVGDVTVTAGRHYYGSEGGGENVYSQTLPHQNVSWEGNTVTLDFTGINWNMPSGTSEVTIMVSGPIGTNMLPANYDGIPVLQEYLPFTTEGAEIDEPIISYIDPLDGVTFPGIFEDETIQITLLENFSNTYSLVGVLTDIEGGQYGTYDFEPTMRGTWLYEITDDVVFYEDMTYLLTVTAYAEDGTKLGSQVVYWYGNTPRGDQPEPDDIWYVRCNANNFNPNGDTQWALLPSENEEENGIYTGMVKMTEDFQFNLLSPYGMVFIPMVNYDPQNVEVEFENDVFEGNTDYAFDETEEALVWTVADYAGVELTITIDTNEGVVTLRVPEGSGVQFNVADGSAVYFDLQGRKIANPDKGIYIKVQDGKAVKVIK